MIHITIIMYFCRTQIYFQRFANKSRAFLANISTAGSINRKKNVKKNITWTLDRGGMEWKKYLVHIIVNTIK